MQMSCALSSGTNTRLGHCLQPGACTASWGILFSLAHSCWHQQQQWFLIVCKPLLWEKQNKTKHTTSHNQPKDHSHLTHNPPPQRWLHPFLLILPLQTAVPHTHCLRCPAYIKSLRLCPSEGTSLQKDVFWRNVCLFMKQSFRGRI